MSDNPATNVFCSARPSSAPKTPSPEAPIVPRHTSPSRSIARLAVPLLLCGCGSAPPADGADRSKMASDLVQCRNEQSTLKDQIADLRAELAKAKVAADHTVRTEPVDVKAAPPEARHVEGNLPAEEISKVVRANAKTLRVCYEKGLKRNPNLQTVSMVKAHFFIRGNGHGERAGIAPHVEPEMESCMAAAIEKWRFPEFAGDPVEVETPVNLVAH